MAREPSTLPAVQPETVKKADPVLTAIRPELVAAEVTAAAEPAQESEPQELPEVHTEAEALVSLRSP